MANPDIRVRLSPEGVEEVLAALRKIRAESKGASKGAAAEVGVLNQALAELKSIIPTLGLAATVVGVIALGKSALETGENLNKMSQRVGASVEELSALRYAMLTADVTAEQLEKGMVKLARNIVELRNGSEKITESFEELGLSAASFDGKTTGEAFVLVAERIGKMQDGLEKSALAFELFGKGGAAMIPLLNEIAEKGFATVRKEAEEAGLIFSTEFAKAAEKANDQLKLTKHNAEALAITFTTGLAPGLAQAVEEFRKATSSGGSDAFRELGEGFGKFLLLVTRGVLIAGNAIATFVALVEEKAKNLKRTLAEVAGDAAKGATAGAIVGGAAGSIIPGVGTVGGAGAGAVAGGISGAVHALTRPSPGASRQTEILDEFSKKIEEILKTSDPKKLAEHKKAIDALLGGDEAGEARAAGTKERIAVLTKKLRTDELKDLSELAKASEATNERLIIAERKLADERAAKDAQTTEGRKRVEDAERGVFLARVAGAEEAAKRELDIINLRTNALLKAAATEYKSAKEVASVTREVEKQAAEARLAVNVKLYQELAKLREDELNKARAAASIIIALDKEIAANKKESTKFSDEITLAGLGEQDKVGFQIRRANDALGELQSAALQGNIEKARELRGEVLALAKDIARLGEGRAAERIFEEANSLFELAANARKLQATEAGDIANKEAERLKIQLKAIKDAIGAQANQIVATINPKVDNDALRTLIEDIQKTLASQTFTVNVYPKMVGGGGVTIPGGEGGVGGAAEGGKIRGYSPSPKADNILLRGTAGEFMQPVRAVQHYGTDFMEAIRTLQFPRYAEGGSLGDAVDAGGGGPSRVIELRAGGRRARVAAFGREGLRDLVEVLQQAGIGDDG